MADNKLSDKMSTPEVSRNNLEYIESIPQLEMAEQPQYRMYRRRWAGLAALGFLNIISGMNSMWFSAIAIETANEFSFTVTQINWFSNAINIIYIPVSCFVPYLSGRFGVRTSCMIGATCLLGTAWLRYASTAMSLSPTGAYAIMMTAQCLTGFAQPLFQVVGPRYSELWFDLSSRTTATMVAALANPLGIALAQLLAPIVGPPRQSILVLAIITSVLTPSVLIIQAAPPTPPTFSGSQKSPGFFQTLRATFGKPRANEVDKAMSLRERWDFVIVAWGFGVLVAAITTFSTFVNQIFAPYGYSDDTAGLMGATLLLSGFVGAIATAPLFDRVFTHHLALTIRTFVPIIAVAWVGLIFAVKENGQVGIFLTLAIIGLCSFTLLPVSLELAVEVTRSPEASSAVLWLSANLFTVIFVLVEDSLRAPLSANPPENMRKALVFQGSIVAITTLVVIGFRGRQVRREKDSEFAKRPL